MKCISIRHLIVKHVSGKIKEPCENLDLGKLLFELLCNVFITLHINEHHALRLFRTQNEQHYTIRIQYTSIKYTNTKCNYLS